MTRVSRALAAALASIIVVPVPSLGRAADPTPPDDRKASARALHEEATAHYKLGRFAEALDGYERAYQHFAAPEFLFNIAQCHFQLEAWDRAIFFFEGYLRELPKAKNRKLVEELIAEAEVHRKRDIAAEELRIEAERARLEAEQRAREEAAKQRPIERDPAFYETWWFWTLVGGVAIGSAATAVALSRDTRTVMPEGSLGTWDRR